MNKYIDAEKLKKSIGNYVEGARAALNPIDGDADYYKGKIDACKDIQEFIASLHQEQQPEYVRKDMVVDAIKLAYGKVSMNPFDCSDAFEELLKKIRYEIH